MVLRADEVSASTAVDSLMGRTASPLERVPTAWNSLPTQPELMLVAVFSPFVAAMAMEARGASGYRWILDGYWMAIGNEILRMRMPDNQPTPILSSAL